MVQSIGARLARRIPGECFHHNHTMWMSITEKWFPRLLTLLIWALVAASAVYWGLRWGETRAGSVPVAAAAPATQVDSSAVARVLGAAPTTAAPVASAPGRLVLVGVAARSHSSTGAALIAVDGKPAKAYGVGARLEDGLYLVAVAPRRALLATTPHGPASLTLELPPAKP